MGLTRSSTRDLMNQYNHPHRGLSQHNASQMQGDILLVRSVAVESLTPDIFVGEFKHDVVPVLMLL